MAINEVVTPKRQAFPWFGKIINKNMLKQFCHCHKGFDLYLTPVSRLWHIKNQRQKKGAEEYDILMDNKNVSIIQNNRIKSFDKSAFRLHQPNNHSFRVKHHIKVTMLHQCIGQNWSHDLIVSVGQTAWLAGVKVSKSIMTAVWGSWVQWDRISVTKFNTCHYFSFLSHFSLPLSEKVKENKMWLYI